MSLVGESKDCSWLPIVKGKCYIFPFSYLVNIINSFVIYYYKKYIFFLQVNENYFIMNNFIFMA